MAFRVSDAPKATLKDGASIRLDLLLRKKTTIVKMDLQSAIFVSESERSA